MPSPPSPKEIEISVFGPGYGESVLVHVPGGDWIIVDSCEDPVTKQPAALSYLESIGVDVASNVKLIVATHWHDDHIRGMSTTVEKCKSAKFALSSALRCDEFLNLVNALGQRSMIRGSSGLDEFNKVIKILLARAEKKDPAYASPIFATENQCIWSSKADPGCRVYSLSPSDHSKLQVAQEFENLFPSEATPKRRIIPLLPNINHISVALWIEIGPHAILLGADLEDSESQHFGWTRIANAGERPQGKAQVFKIPHHGSETAHCEAVWDAMLIPNPLCICTPYNRGKSLPTVKDTERIHGKTDKAYITASKKVKEVGSKRIWHVEKMLKTSQIKFTDKPYKLGQVRIRFVPNTTPEAFPVETFENACSLKDFEAK